MMKGGTKDVKIVRMSRGRRMSEEAFNSLSEKDKIRVLRLAPMLAETIRRVNNEESLSAMFDRLELV